MRVALWRAGVVATFLITSPVFANTDIPCEVSAYYTPALGQEDFESAIAMNGRGTHGADGTAVYEGMLSASKTYDFGTKIFIPGLGVGAVHDRGGAVTGNKIDVWMGYGAEGKKRALQWGRKTLTCVIAENKDIAETITFDTSSKKFTKNLEIGDKGSFVEEMQLFLAEQGVFHETNFGYFGPKTEKAVFDFQKEHGIVKSMDDEGAGMWGPKTRAAANKAVKK